MNITLSSEQMQFVQSKIAAGEYQTPEQVVEVALGLLQTVQSEEVFDRIVELRERIRIGTEQILQGKVKEGEEVFDHLQQRLVQEFGLTE